MKQSQMQTQQSGGQSQSQSQSQGRVNRLWRPAAIFSFFLSMLALYEPAKDIYREIGVPGYDGLTSTLFASRQHELSEKNAACSATMERAKIEVNATLSITYGVCPNLDVSIGVIPKDLRGYERWLEPNRRDDVAGYREITSALPVRSGEALGQPARTILKTLCLGSNDEQQIKIDRVTNEGGQCYYERINTLSGAIEVREIVPCDSQCGVVSKMFQLEKP